MIFPTHYQVHDGPWAARLRAVVKSHKRRKCPVNRITLTRILLVAADLSFSTAYRSLRLFFFKYQGNISNSLAVEESESKPSENRQTAAAAATWQQTVIRTSIISRGGGLLDIELI